MAINTKLEKTKNSIKTNLRFDDQKINMQLKNLLESRLEYIKFQIISTFRSFTCSS